MDVIGVLNKKKKTSQNPLYTTLTAPMMESHRWQLHNKLIIIIYYYKESSLDQKHK